MRIAMAGIGTESCTFSRTSTSLQDFVVRRGSEIFAGGRYPFVALTVGAVIPVIWARAMPGGPVTAAAYAAFKADFVTGLQAAMPLDGLYLDMHGAMVVDGLDDAEADWFAAARAVVGPDCPIAASFDLHGNLSAAAAGRLDMLTAYRTAPHIDELATRAKAWALLLRAVTTGSRPVVRHIAVPVLLPGERTSTVVDPAARLYAGLTAVDAWPGVWDASIFMGYPWADDARAGACVVVTAETDLVAASVAREVAGRFWAVRHGFVFGVPAGDIDWCIRTALAADVPCVFISDSGDNPTAGAPGDVPLALARLLAHGVNSAVVAAIVDPAAVAAAMAAGIGNTVAVSLGGKLDPDTAPPLLADAVVRQLLPADPRGGDIAVLAVGGIDVIVTSRRRPYHFLADFRALGLEPLSYRIVVVKIGYLEPDLAANAPMALLALTPGCVDQDIPRLSFHKVRRPIFPIDPDMVWTPP